MQSTQLHSPAKINLGLQVHHRRSPDGYHYLSSIFIPLSFGDALQIEVGHQDQLHSKIDLPADLAADYAKVSEEADLKSNLIWQVLNATRSLRPQNQGLNIQLTKRIPTGGGLGGGSSNAGTLLRWIKEYYELSHDQIFPIALRLGADVPFFLDPTPAFITGIGEERSSISIGKGYGVLCVSGVHVNTREAYIQMKRTLQETPPPKTLRGLDVQTREALQKADWAAARSLENDFEPVVFAMHPELAAIKAAFYDIGAAFALMSGSGATVFGLVESTGHQSEVLKSLQSAYPDYHFWPFELG